MVFLTAGIVSCLPCIGEYVTIDMTGIVDRARRNEAAVQRWEI